MNKHTKTPPTSCIVGCCWEITATLMSVVGVLAFAGYHYQNVKVNVSKPRSVCQLQMLSCTQGCALTEQVSTKSDTTVY